MASPPAFRRPKDKPHIRLLSGPMRCWMISHVDDAWFSDNGSWYTYHDSFMQCAVFLQRAYKGAANVNR